MFNHCLHRYFFSMMMCMATCSYTNSQVCQGHLKSLTRNKPSKLWNETIFKLERLIHPSIQAGLWSETQIMSMCCPRTMTILWRQIFSRFLEAHRLSTRKQAKVIQSQPLGNTLQTKMLFPPQRQRRTLPPRPIPACLLGSVGLKLGRHKVVVHLDVSAPLTSQPSRRWRTKIQQSSFKRIHTLWIYTVIYTVILYTLKILYYASMVVIHSTAGNKHALIYKHGPK